MTPAPSPRRVYGVLAEFGDADRLLRAARAARRAGYRRMDAYTPMPVHGLSAALGQRDSRLPLIVLIGGLAGGAGGFFLQWYSSAVHYPMNVGGKPFNSWPAFMVITFELTILVAGIAAVLGMLAINGLPRLHHPLFNVPEFELASGTHFFLCIEARDPVFRAPETTDFLRGLGATSVWLVPTGHMPEAESPAVPAPPEQQHHGLRPPPGPSAPLLLLLLAAACAAGPPGCDNVNRGMDDEARITPYEPSDFFEDRRSVRPLVEGTVPRGGARADEHLYEGTVGGVPATEFPFPVTRATLERGRERFNIYCAVCHNATGDGRGMIVQRGFVPPPSLHIDRLREAPVGHFFGVITNGWGAMYSYSDRVAPEDRWAITAYIRVLQLSQSADPAWLPPEERARAAAPPGTGEPAGSGGARDGDGDGEGGP